MSLVIGAHERSMWCSIHGGTERIQKIMSAIGSSAAQNTPPGASCSPGLKSVLVASLGPLGGLGGQKKRVVSEPGIEPGDSRWQRLMLPLHHSEQRRRPFWDPGIPKLECHAWAAPEPPFQSGPVEGFELLLIASFKQKSLIESCFGSKKIWGHV